jgi:ABC-type glycerol-3-phosphate transport system substrate-binding protein
MRDGVGNGGESLGDFQSPTPNPWLRPRSRRDILKMGVGIAAAASAGALVEACFGSSSSPTAGTTVITSVPTGSSISGPITFITGGGDPTSQPGLIKVFNVFATEHPGATWDIRPLPGFGPDWDRLARAAMASGDPIDLIMINGQQVGGWERDGLLADLSPFPELADVLARVPEQFHFGGVGQSTTRVFPLAVTLGIDTTGLYFNKALLDKAGIAPPSTIADLKASVAPLSKIGVASLVHNSGDAPFNQILLTWILPQIAERTTDPIEFATSTVKGQIRYDGPEWVEAFNTIDDLRSSGVFMKGSAATDYGTMQQLLLTGKAAMTYQGTWLLPQLRAGTPVGPFDLHVVAPPAIDANSRPRPIVAWAGFALPATAARSRAAALSFLQYASQPDVDKQVVAARQTYSPLTPSNDAITDPLAREFLPMFEDAITPLDWLWEPEVKDEIDRQVQGIVRGDTTGHAAGTAVQAVADQLRSSGRSYFR